MAALKQTTFWGLLLRIAIALGIHLFVSENTFAPDQATYHLGGAALARYWNGETLVPPWFYSGQQGRNGYYFIVAAQYFALAPWPLFPKLLNAAVGSLSVPLAFEVASRVTGSAEVGLRTARYVAYFPSLVLWSALNIRDVWVVLLILLISREALRLQEKFSLKSLVLLGAAILAIVQFRDYIFFAVVAPVLLSFLVRARGSSGRNAVAGLLIALVVVLADHVVGTDRRGRTLDLETLSELREGTAIGGATSFEPHADISTPGAALLFLPRGLAFFLLGPFPWTIVNLRQAFTAPEMLFFYALLPAMMRGLLHLVRHRLREALMILLIMAAVTLGYALGQANQGTAYRHRAQVLPFYLMLGATGVELRRRQREKAGAVPRLIERRA